MLIIGPNEQKTNDPRDLEPPQPGGGLNSKPEFEAFHARDPHVPSPQVLNNLPPAKVSIFFCVTVLCRVRADAFACFAEQGGVEGSGAGA